jgi:transcription factor E2F4/5
MAAQNLPEQHVSERSQTFQQTPAAEVSSGWYRGFGVKTSYENMNTL